MKSRLHIKGHPLHPMLTPFPFAFLVGAFAADVAGTLLGVPGLWITAWYLSVAGVATGLLAAVTGLVDLLFTLPPNTSAKKRATWHMVVNVIALILFALAWFVRGADEIPPDPAILLVEAVAVVFLLAGAWIGGALVYRNHVGVNRRHAGAAGGRVPRFPGRAKLRPGGGNPVENRRS